MFLVVLISLEFFFGSFQWSSDLTIALLGNDSITCYIIWPIIWCLANLWQQLLSHYYSGHFYYYRGLRKKRPLHSSEDNGEVNFRPPGNTTLLLLRRDSQDCLKSVSLTMEQERSVVSHGSGILNTTYRIEASTAIGAEKRMPMRRGEGWKVVTYWMVILGCSIEIWWRERMDDCASNNIKVVTIFWVDHRSNLHYGEEVLGDQESASMARRKNTTLSHGTASEERPYFHSEYNCSVPSEVPVQIGWDSGAKCWRHRSCRIYGGT